LGSCVRNNEFLVSIRLREFIDLLGTLGLSRGSLLQGDDDGDDDDVVSVSNFIHFYKCQIPKILCHGNENEGYEHADG